MRRAIFPLIFIVLIAITGFAATPGPETTFVGNISDGMCGMKHMMAGKTPKECADECVKMGDKYVLADEASHKVYNLSNQAKVKPFSGQKVRVSGSLNGNTIQVKTISGAK